MTSLLDEADGVYRNTECLLTALPYQADNRSAKSAEKE